MVHPPKHGRIWFSENQPNQAREDEQADCSKRPRAYTDAQILKIELVKRFDKNLRHTRSIARCLKWDKDLRKACGLKTRTPHFSTISRRRRKLQVKILVLISHEILKYLISLGA
ncbi:MAG: transposase, partial [Actinomycetota bacterium]